MDSIGSARERTALPWPLGPLAVLLGVLLMYLCLALARPLGLRPALIVSEAALAVPGLVLLAFFGIRMAMGLGLRPAGGGTVALSLVVGGALWAASLGLLELQYLVWRPPPGYLEAFRRLHELLRPANPLDALASLAAIALAPALFEETLFRGVVLPSFRAALGAAGAVLASAALFSAIHLDFTQAGPPVLYRVPFAFVVGAGLGALRVRTGSLVPSVLAHATLNTITLAATPLMDDPSAVPEAKPLLGTALFLAGSAAATFLFRKLPREGDPGA